MSHGRYLLVLRSVPSDVPAELRLRRVLKMLARGYGFHCEDCRELSEEDSAPAPGSLTHPHVRGAAGYDEEGGTGGRR